MTQKQGSGNTLLCVEPALPIPIDIQHPHSRTDFVERVNRLTYLK